MPDTATPAARNAAWSILDRVSPVTRPARPVTVLGGRPHAPANAGTIDRTPANNRDVGGSDRGGVPDDIHRHHGAGAGTTVGADLNAP